MGATLSTSTLLLAVGVLPVGRNGISTDAERTTMLNIKVALPSVHMAGSDAHYNAHIEVGQHGFALFLAPNAEYPILDVNGTSEQLTVVVRGPKPRSRRGVSRTWMQSWRRR